MRVRIRCDGALGVLLRLWTSTRGAIAASHLWQQAGAAAAGLRPAGRRTLAWTGELWSAAQESFVAADPAQLTLLAGEEQPAEAARNEAQEALRRPLAGFGRWYGAAVVLGSLAVLGGLACWNYQLGSGLGVAVSQRAGMPGLYFAAFLFWMGVAASATLGCGVLRLWETGRRLPLTRALEITALFAPLPAGLFLAANLGRLLVSPWLLWPNFRSPLLWMVVLLGALAAGNLVPLCLSVIPEAAELRPQAFGWQAALYGALSQRWTGAARQWRARRWALQGASTVLAVLGTAALLVAAWMAAPPLEPRLPSGAQFVAAALLRGLALWILVLAVIRWTTPLEDLLPPAHFARLGQLLAGAGVVWFAAAAAAYLAARPVRRPALDLAAAVVILGSVVAPLALRLRWPRSLPATAAAAAGVIAAMWIECCRTVLPAGYLPSGIEVTITLAGFAGFVLLGLLFAKLFPLVTVPEPSPAPAARPAAC